VAELVDTVPVQNILGEGPLWSVRDARLWWTDIQGRRLYRYDPVARTFDENATPERLCSFAFVAGSNRLIAAFESGLLLYDPVSGAVQWLHRWSGARRASASTTGGRIAKGASGPERWSRAAAPSRWGVSTVSTAKGG
jgi:sugar lactone lactonase YvrE